MIHESVNMLNLGRFYESLRTRRSGEFSYNPYHIESPRNFTLGNLKQYIEYMREQKTKVFLVGEAPGYKGCALTGIPFTSQEVVESKKHTIWQRLAPNIVLNDDHPGKENTATIVWKLLEELNYLPLFWNAFPFHPHERNDVYSNRKPDSFELREGAFYLTYLIEYFKPEHIIAIGRQAQNTLSRILNKEIKYIRHPSMGGACAFRHGMRDLQEVLDSQK